MYKEQRNYVEAERLYRNGLAIDEKALGGSHPDVAKFFSNLADAYKAQGKYAEAEELYRRALVVREQTFGQDHPEVAAVLDNLASLFAASGDAENALVYARKATSSVIAHAAAETIRMQRKEGAGGLVDQRTDYFVRHVANLAAAAQKRLEPPSEFGREAFVMAQWAKQSAAAAAVQQMGLRLAAGSDALQRWCASARTSQLSGASATRR